MPQLSPEEIDALDTAPEQNRTVVGLTPQAIDAIPAGGLSAKDIDEMPVAAPRQKASPIQNKTFGEKAADAWEQVRNLPAQIAMTRIEETPDEERPSEYTERIMEGGWPAVFTTSPAKLLHPTPTAEERANELRTVTSGYKLDDEGKPVPLVPVSQKPLTTGEKIAMGVGDTGDDLVNFMTSPAGVASLGIGLLPKIAQRVIAAGFSAKMASQLPDRYQAIKSELAKPEADRDYRKIGEQASGAVADLGFAAAGAVGATKGVALDVPAINRALTEHISESYSPEQLRDIYNRVNAGGGTTVERDLVEFINDELGKPIKAIRRGATVTETQSKIGSEFWRKYLGLDEGTGRTVTVGTGTSAPKRARALRFLSDQEIDNIQPAATPQPESPNATTAKSIEGSVPVESQGVATLGKEEQSPGTRDLLPSPAGQPTENVQGRAGEVSAVAPASSGVPSAASVAPQQPIAAAGAQPIPTGEGAGVGQPRPESARVGAPTLPPKHTAVIVRREDGTEYPAAFGGYWTQLPGVPPVISRWDDQGQAWSTGSLNDGETIVAGDVPQKPEQTPMPVKESEQKHELVKPTQVNQNVEKPGIVNQPSKERPPLAAEAKQPTPAAAISKPALAAKQVESRIDELKRSAQVLTERGRKEASKRRTQEAKDVKEELLRRIDEAAKDAPLKKNYDANKHGVVEISIPGDGDFKIARNVEALEAVRTKVKRISTTPVAKVKEAHVSREEISDEDVIKAYGSPERAYQIARSQVEALVGEDEDSKKARGRAEELADRIYARTKAGQRAADAASAELGASEKRAEIAKHEAEIQRVSGLKKPNQKKLSELLQLIDSARQTEKTLRDSAVRYKSQEGEEKAKMEAETIAPINQEARLPTESTQPRTLDEIRQLLPAMALPKEAVGLIGALIEGPLSKLATDRLTPLLNDVMENGWMGSALAHAMAGARFADSQTGAYDLVRFIWNLLPTDLAAEFEHMRVRALDSIARESKDKPELSEQAAALRDNPADGRQFAKLGLPESLYPYSNPVVLFEHGLNPDFKPQVGAMGENFWQRVRDIPKHFVASIKQSTELNTRQRNFLDGIANGTFRTATPSQIAAEEAQDPTVAYSVEGQAGALEGEELRAKGIEQIKELLNDPRAGLPSDVVSVALDILDQPVMQSLDWSKLGLELRNRIAPGVPGRASISAIDWLVTMTRSASPQTFPHEIFHLLERMLPPADRERLEEFRLQELDRAAEAFKSGFPPGAKEVLDILRQGITSKQFVELRAKAIAAGETEAAEWLSGLYHLINPSEFLASLGGRKFASESFDKDQESWFQGLLTRLKAWLQGLIDALRRTLRRSKDFDQIYREILSGKTARTPESGAEAERDVQMSIEDDAAARSAQQTAEQQAEPWGVPGEQWVRTQVMGQDWNVRGREFLPAPEVINGYAKAVFDRMDISVTWDTQRRMWVFDRTGFDQNLEFQKLLQELKKEIQAYREPGKPPGILATLLDSTRRNASHPNSAMMDLPPSLRADLVAVSQGEASFFGATMSAYARLKPEFNDVAQSVDVVLNKVFSDAFGGQAIRDLIDKVMVNFGQMFSESEIKAALAGHPNAQQIIEQIIALNVQRVGSRLFNRLHNTLRPKQPLAPAALERNAKLDEAYDAVIETLKREYGIEPKERPGKKRLTPQEKLALMVDEKTATAVGQAIGNAVNDAEYNAGRAAMIKASEREKDPQKKQDLEDHLALMQQTAMDRENRIAPLPEYVEEGFQLPEFRHWLNVREHIGYSPTSMKLVQDVIRGQFKGTKFATGKAMPKDTRLDLNGLAKAPAEEVVRALDAFFDNVSGVVEMGSASEETKSRVMTSIEGQIIDQLNKAMARARDPIFREPKKGTPVTAEQRALQLLNAGLFADPRLNIPEMVQRAASKSAIKRLMPKVIDLTKQVFDTPFYRQDELAERFADYLTTKLRVDPSQVAKARELFEEAFKEPISKAKEAAYKQAVESLTPKQRKAFRKYAVLERIHRMLNAGGADPTQIINEIAAKNGMDKPTEAVVRHMRELSERVQRMQELTPAEIERIKRDFPLDFQNWVNGLSDREKQEQQSKEATMGSDAYQAAMLQQWLENARKSVASEMSPKIGLLNREIAAIWARLERPMKWNKWWATRKNIADAANEVEVANMLAKIGFPFRLLTHMGTQFAIFMPTRAIGFVAARFKEGDIAPAEVWSELGATLLDGFNQLKKSIMPSLVAARGALLGRSTQARNVDRLITGVAAFDRLELLAKEAEAKGETVRANAMRLFGLVKFSLRYTQACDVVFGTPVEYQEISNLLRSALKEKGYTDAQELVMHDRIMGDLPKKYQDALVRARQAFENRGEKYTEAMLQEGAYASVLSGMYGDIRLAMLPADAFRERIELLRQRVAWQEPVRHGLGGIATYVGKSATAAMRNLGLPLSFTRFSNAIGNGINYSLGFTMAAPLGFATFKLPGTTEESPYQRTEEDRQEFRARWILGTVFGSLMAYLVWKGMLRVFARPPADKRERELWEKAGHRAGTVEIVTGPDTFIPLSLTVGPVSIMAPYLVGASSALDLAVRREKQQAKLNAEAEAKGLTPGHIGPPDLFDLMAVAGSTAWGTLMGSKTFSGIAQSVTENASFNVKKGFAAYISPVVPGLPAYQEITRAMGWNMDPCLASVWDFLVPNPTSGARALNFLGEPVGTPDAIQRMIQTLTAGSYPWEVDSKQAKSLPAYESLFATGYRPPAIDPNKGYAIGQEWRPFNDKELEEYTFLRGENFRKELIALGPTDDQKLIRQAYQRANEAALEAVGADLPESGGRATSRASVAGVGQPATLTSAVGVGTVRTPLKPTSGGYRRLSSPSAPHLSHSIAPRLASRGRRVSALRRMGPRIGHGKGLALPKRRVPALRHR